MNANRSHMRNLVTVHIRQCEVFDGGANRRRSRNVIGNTTSATSDNGAYNQKQHNEQDFQKKASCSRIIA